MSMKKVGLLLLLISASALAQPTNLPGLGGPAIVTSEFIFQAMPTPECHASTIVETTNGLVAAWFGGTQEKALDVGIWLSRFQNHQWSPPEEVPLATTKMCVFATLCGTRSFFNRGKGPWRCFIKKAPAPKNGGAL